MPTLRISAPTLPAGRRRAVAVRLTRWLRDHGVPPGHVVVHFDDLPPNSVFSGAVPVEALAAPAADLPCASVVCQVGPDRDEPFRSALAREIADSLGADDDTGFLSIEFRVTRPEHVHVWRQGGLCRADQPLDAAAALSAPQRSGAS